MQLEDFYETRERWIGIESIGMGIFKVMRKKRIDTLL